MRILLQLEAAGHCAVAVGGCVRDLLLEKLPGDWDAATDATPHEMRAIFSSCKVLETGARYGTLTVLQDGLAVEITTFRTDGPTVDARHPDSVVFGKNLREDCARRDFTVNALCVDARFHLYDFHDGLRDLKQKTIRCIGTPAQRFGEDALRILRALRFACQLGFTIDEITADAIHQQVGLLFRLSPERVAKELLLLLQADSCAAALIAYSDVLQAVLPAQIFAKPPDDARRTVLLAADRLPGDAALRLALLLSYREKGEDAPNEPLCDEAERLLRDLHTSNAFRRRVLLILNALPVLPADNERQLAQSLLTHKKESLHDALSVLTAVASEKRDSRLLESLFKTGKHLTAITACKLCLSPGDLAVSGDDLLRLGISPGPLVGKLLGEMVEQVLIRNVPNERDALLLWAAQRITQPTADLSAHKQ
jgi:tRNA nucleotidyltransferase (CCA-adding enzyme)